jgi:hypothetical protein
MAAVVVPGAALLALGFLAFGHAEWIAQLLDLREDKIRLSVPGTR